MVNMFKILDINFSVKNSKQFINHIKDIMLKPSDVLISFDVTSLFQRAQTLNFLREILYNNYFTSRY